MEPFYNSWHIFSSFIVFILGLVSVNLVSDYFRIRKKDATIIYIWHALFCIAYYWYIIYSGGDVIRYWMSSQNEIASFKPGTVAILWSVKILHFFDFSIIGAFFVFNIFGSIGLLAFYAALRSVVIGRSRKLQRLVLLLIFLPSVSFWSSGIGKDSLSFMAVGLALWSSLALDKRKTLMIIAVSVMFFVRPHMAGIMVIALALSMLLQRNVSPLQRLFLGGIAITASAIVVPFALNFAGVGEGAADLQAYIEQRQGYNQEGGGGVNISSMSLPMQLFTYVFRPLPLEVRSIPQLAAALDNIILLYLAIVGGRAILKTRGVKLEGNRLFMWFYVLIAWLILAITTANLGISVRQKWMFTPVLIYLLISLFAAREARNTEINNG